MRGKAALVVGLVAGYVLGARAGRDRYEQIKTQAGKVWDQPFIFASRDGKALKGNHYTGNLNIWSLLFGIDGKSLSRVRAVPPTREGNK